MKKFLSRLLMFLLIFAMLLEPATALVGAAEVEVPTTGITKLEGEHYYATNPLYGGTTTKKTEAPEEIKAHVTNDTVYSSIASVGKVIRKQMVARNTDWIYVWYKTTNFDPDAIYRDVYNAFFDHTGNPKEGDNLRWQWSGVSYGYTGESYVTSDGVYYLELYYGFSYKTTLAQENKLDTAVANLLNSLNLDGLTDYQKIYKIYDWMTKNIRYDYDHYYSNPDYELQYTAYAALVDRTCVCQGYANLFYRLALEVGVDARIIAGGSGYGYPSSYGAHSWNIVKMGNYYYNIDATWDESASASPSTWNYFLLNEANFTLHYRDNGEYFQLSNGKIKGIDYTSTSFYNKYPMGKSNYDPNKDVSIAAPTLKVSNVASTGKIKLSWNKVSGAAKYEIYRATSQNGTYTKLSTVTGTSATNTKTDAGKTYYYKIRAIDADGNKSAYSNVVSRMCDLPRPVVTVSNVASTGKIKLSWEKVEGATKYEIYRATSKDGTYTKLSTVTGTSATNTKTDAGKTYYYKVKAIHSNSSANSAYSAVVSRTCDLPQPKVTVSNVASTGKIKLSWEKIAGATGYEIYRATSKTGTYTKLSTVTGTSATNTKADAGKTYYYKVRAIHSNSSANSAYSSIVSRTCDLARPTLAVKLNSNGKPLLSWNKVSGAAKYTIYIYDANGNLLKTASTTNLQIAHGSAVAGKTYQYRIVAVHSNTSANSAKSNLVSIKSK